MYFLNTSTQHKEISLNRTHSRHKGKVKVNLFLCKTKYHAMKMYPVLNYAPCHEDALGSGGIVPSILNLDTKWRRVVSLTLRPLYLWGRSPLTHWTGGWVGPRASLDLVAKRKKSHHCPTGNWTLVVHLIAQSLYWLSYYTSRYTRH
jgi:hypothetical protein